MHYIDWYEVANICCLSFSENMEMHIVFYNTKYESFEDANQQFRPTRDALVVFSVLITVCNSA